MNPIDLSPAEAWDAAEEQIDLWLEDRSRKEWLKWRQMNGC